MRRFLASIVLTVIGCGGREATVVPLENPVTAQINARLPKVPGDNGPSLVMIDRRTGAKPGDVSDGTMLSDVDSCATCHPDAAKQWSTSAHSFASFGNPIYRFDVEQFRHDLGKQNSRHCAGCHDMPLLVDGLMTQGPDRPKLLGAAPAPTDIPAADLRAHSGVTCRLCHGIESVSKDGNG